jgi:hypothetical protein
MNEVIESLLRAKQQPDGKQHLVGVNVFQAANGHIKEPTQVFAELYADGSQSDRADACGIIRNMPGSKTRLHKKLHDAFLHFVLWIYESMRRPNVKAMYPPCPNPEGPGRFVWGWRAWRIHCC